MVNLGNRNFINEAIDTWSKLKQIDAYAQQQERETARFNQEQQKWQREEQLRGLMGTDPADNAAVAQATGKPAATSMQPMGNIAVDLPSLKSPAEQAYKAAIDYPQDETPEVAKLRQIGNALKAQNTDDYQAYLTSLEHAAGGRPDQMSDRGAELIIREVVNNPAYNESDPFGQVQAIKALKSVVGQMPAGVKTPYSIDDPQLLQTFSQAFPKIGAQSNLPDARVSKLYVEPSPDGDPLKARLAVGVAGTGADGKPVNGVMTVNRSSDPNDPVYMDTAGTWLSKAENIQRNTEALLQARAKLGDEKAFATFAELRKGKTVADELGKVADKITDPDEKALVQLHAALVRQGNMTPDEGLKTASSIFGKQAQRRQEIEDIRKRVLATDAAEGETEKGKTAVAKAKREQSDLAAQDQVLPILQKYKLNLTNTQSINDAYQTIIGREQITDPALQRALFTALSAMQKETHTQKLGDEKLALLQENNQLRAQIGMARGGKTGAVDQQSRLQVGVLEADIKGATAREKELRKQHADATKKYNENYRGGQKRSADEWRSDSQFQDDKQALDDLAAQIQEQINIRTNARQQIDGLMGVKQPTSGGMAPSKAVDGGPVRQVRGDLSPQAQAYLQQAQGGQAPVSQPQRTAAPQPQPQQAAPPRIVPQGTPVDPLSQLREQVQLAQMQIPRARNAAEKQQLTQAYLALKGKLDAATSADNRQINQGANAAVKGMVNGMAPVNRMSNGQAVPAWQIR